ncbi:MAG: Ppx/GppA family phosphatase [Syntrophomonadaceae bacterium]|nr:Ppx/GppA family phosphatase [Syntrophomonadaceae bacterium]
MKFAAVDFGTNSCRLLIAEILAGKGLVPLYRGLYQNRLGQGLSKSGKISEEAIKRTLKCLAEYTELIQKSQVLASRAVATSAVRDAGNRNYFLEIMTPYFPGAIDIIDGEEEACLTYQGVKHGLSLEQYPVVVDPGGGSTEIIFKQDNSIFIKSLPLGAVRASESQLSREAMLKLLEDGLGDIDRLRGHPLVLVGGTATSLAAMKMALIEYKPEIIHGQVLSFEEVSDLSRRLFSISLEERKKIPGLQPERADIIPQGSRIIELIMWLLSAQEMIVSESDLLDGIIWSLYYRNM